MKHRSLMLVMSILCLGTRLPAQEGVPLEAEIAALEDRLVKLVLSKDRPGLETLLAPDFVLRGDPDIDRDTWLDNAVTLCWGDQGTITSFSVRPLDDAVIATFVLTTNRDPLTCMPAVVRSLVTDVWRRQEGRWVLALRQSGPPGDVGTQFAAAPPPHVWSGKGELSFVSTSGNTSTQSLGTSGEFTYRPEPWQTSARVAFVQAKTDGTETARSITADLRQSRDLTQRAGLYGHLGYLRDQFAGIEHRVGVDGGVSLKVVLGPPHSFEVDLGVGYTRELRLDEPDASFAVATLAYDYAWALTSIADVTDHGSFTANLEDSPDWRFDNRVAVTADLNRLLSLKLSHDLKYRNRPVDGFLRTDQIISAAIVVNF